MGERNRNWAYDQRRGSATDRGYGAAWRRLRARHLSQHPLCVFCEKMGRIEAATVVDHRTAHKGDHMLMFDPGNLQSLCKVHHDSTKQSMERTGKPLRIIDSDGWPCD
ncbi:5-methylcytosine-specific restriction endonuclease McrA [Rhodoligotrophos appendicifer]